MYLAERSSKVSIGGDGDRGQMLLEQEAEGVALMEQGRRSSSGPSPGSLRHYRQVARDRAEAGGQRRPFGPEELAMVVVSGGVVWILAVGAVDEMPPP